MKLSLFRIILLSLLLLGVSCTFTKRVKDGDTAFNSKQYATAVSLLKSEYADAKDKSIKKRKAEHLGYSYDMLQDYGTSVKWYEKARSHSDNPSPALAFAYKKNEQYAQASEVFKTLCALNALPRMCQERKLCDEARKAVDSEDYEIVSYSANTKYSEYSPTFFGNDFLVFTSDRNSSTGKGTYEWTGNSFSDLYVIALRGRKVNNFDAIINTAANEGTACFSKDLNEIFFTRCSSINERDQYCKIYYSQRPNGFWMEPEPLMFFDERTNFAHPCLIEKDSVLVFSASPKSGGPNTDLYYSQRVEGGWSEPFLMPGSINSEDNEKFPTSHNDTLYYSSDGKVGFGGYDIFKTYLNDNGSWASPENMGRPINSGADDFGIAVDREGTAKKDVVLQGYFTSSRNVGTGDDLFFFTQRVPLEDESEEDSMKKDEKDEPIVSLAVIIQEAIYEVIDGQKKLLKYQTIPDASLKTTPAVDASEISLTNGYRVWKIKEGEQVMLEGSASGYLTDRVTVSSVFDAPISNDTTINVKVILEKIEYDKEVTLDNIYYDYNKWDIRADARPALDTLYNMLELNPALNIQLSSHTDCRGEDDFNQDLSQKRAQSTVEYLVQKGIQAYRLTARGYGESVPTVTCPCDDCTEAQHQSNRRTTFKIVR